MPKFLVTCESFNPQLLKKGIVIRQQTGRTGRTGKSFNPQLLKKGIVILLIAQIDRRTVRRFNPQLLKKGIVIISNQMEQIIAHLFQSSTP